MNICIRRKMSLVQVTLFLLSSSILVSATEREGCPFASSKDTSKPDIRGHGQPYGYHAKQWKRIETLYEHPPPKVFYEKYMRGSKPVIIRGGAKDWPALQKWTNLTYLNHQARFGRPDINWKKMYSYDPFHPVRVRMKMKEFTRDFDKYNLYMDATLPSEIAHDVNWPDSLKCRFFLKRTKQLAIMFNNGKSSSDLHMDSTCTYFVQVTGSRRWLLSHPDDVAKVYSGTPNLVDHLGISIVNQTTVDLEKHWLLRDLPIYGAIMEPGDIIYVPEGWHHQVKTYDSPNIGVVVFMNYLLCEFHSNPDDNDIKHVKKCVFRIREQRPKTLECDRFHEEKLPIPELIKKYSPPAPDVFMASFEVGGDLTYGVAHRIMNNGEEMLPMGISLVGHGKQKDKKLILTQAIREGFKKFCISMDDESPDLIAAAIRRHKKLRRRISLVAYLPKRYFGKVKAKKGIDSLLERLNTTRIDVLLLQADYCPSQNGTDPCARDQLTPDMIETWKEMEKAYRNEKIKTLGVSDFSLLELKKLMKIATIPISIARARFDPYFRNKEYRNFCRENKILFMGRSILAGRWKTERPDFPENRDITKEYMILRASFQYKTSVHGVVYDWAVKKGVVICPPMDESLHVRVTAQAFRTESARNPDNLQNIDEATDPTDKGLVNIDVRNYLQEPTEGEEPVEVGEDRVVYDKDVSDSFNKQYIEMQKTEKDFSNEVYTDSKDFEKFPSFMNIKDPFSKERNG